MRVITLWQPWASLIAEGVKTIETRPKQHPWRSAIGQTIAIHASAKPLSRQIKSDYYGIYPGQGNHSGLVHGPVGARICNALDRAGFHAADGSDLPLGAVVATCRITDVVFCGWLASVSPAYLTLSSKHDDKLDITDQIAFGDFSVGRYALLLDRIEKLREPFPCTGRQGLWTLDPNVESMITSVSSLP